MDSPDLGKNAIWSSSFSHTNGFDLSLVVDLGSIVFLSLSLIILIVWCGLNSASRFGFYWVSDGVVWVDLGLVSIWVLVGSSGGSVLVSDEGVGDSGLVVMMKDCKSSGDDKRLEVD
ncbi:hypothetical protein Dsin_032567 [Dipteronia sinensis]|uniref:Transmembrane protein n=1 Tax=Dipteronia sinensis TaxID=43782 RepID=A0AAD9Z9B2_9ROSI|nr:hypothetical protein Dsin_032567 [Dipteronia sinensis]